MSDLQDLIHKTSIDCIEKGQRMERERIIKLLEERLNRGDIDSVRYFVDALMLIKGETNE